jgi:cytoskeletal protein RodZ
MNEENEIDDLFKGKLKQPDEHSAYNEMDWSSMEELLDEKKKRRLGVFWLRSLSVAAALVLMLGGWWLFSGRKNLAPGVPEPLAHVAKPNHTGSNGGAILQKPAQAPHVAKPEQIASYNHAQSGVRPVFSPSAVLPGNATEPVVPLADNLQSNSANRDEYALDLIARQARSLATQQLDEPTIKYTLSSRLHKDTGVKKPTLKTKASFMPHYALTVWAAPDENSVGGFQDSKPGDNVGLLFSAEIFKKVTISTGALYSDKPYSTDFSNYHTGDQFPVSPDYVNADCHMLDIPLNIGYQVYSRHQNTFSIGTGLSSYIMLHQSFTFDYANPNVTGPVTYNVPGASGYYFGILNINATYQRRLTPRVGFSIQPYIKLPLSNVGYSQVHLQSTGIAAGLSWDISSSLKP